MFERIVSLNTKVSIITLYVFVFYLYNDLNQRDLNITDISIDKEVNHEHEIGNSMTLMRGCLPLYHYAILSS